MPETGFDFSAGALRARRQSLGLSREHVAIAVNRSVAAVTAWERGDRTPSERVRPLLAAALDSDNSSAAVLSELVRRTTAASNVPERLEDAAASEKVAHALRGEVG
jgi:transcriptional regulator with XRE-family HTH domain